MKVFNYLDDASKLLGECAVALGNFDGVHKGHQQLIKATVQIAKQKNLSSVVFTFSNHPANVIAGDTVVKKIMSLNEKAEAMEALGVDYLVNVCFNDIIRKSDPEYFVKRFLVNNLHAKHAVCGFNYSFGFKAEGTPQILSQLGKKYGFDVSIVPELKIDDMTVSSTAIRNFIAEGNMKKYMQFTGRPYRLEGTVIEGRRVGRTIGFPTINLSLSQEYALPKNGVYVTKTYVNNLEFKSVTNVGIKPTLGTFDKNAETHIFGFDGDIYGESVIIDFAVMLREERRFDNVQALSKQIEQDCIDAESYVW